MSTVWNHVSEGPWSRRRKHQSVVFGTKLMILGGFDGEAAHDLNDVWSYDGNSWVMVTEHAGWSGRDGHCAVVFKGSIYVLGGTDDPYHCKCDVWKSDDGGCNWVQITDMAPWPERWQHAACVHDERIYVIGGWGERYLNDVWSSADGVSWTLECAKAPWKPRMFLSVMNFNDAIYVIGGSDGRSQLGDVWASSDGGKTWIQVCHTAQWEGRQGHATVAVDGYVYLLGGFLGATRFNDVWKSSDCAHWTCVSSECLWSPRQGHACLAHRGSIYILGGFDESGYCNDVCSLKVGTDTVSDLIDFESDFFIENSQSRGHGSPKAKSSKRQITVSTICVLETIEILRKKRNGRETLIRGLINTVAQVMKAVKIDTSIDTSPEGVAARTGTISEDSAETDISEGKFGYPDLMNDLTTTTRTVVKAKAKPGAKSKALSSNLTALSKSGSPYREQLVASGSAVACEKGLESIKSEEDLRMHIWQNLPKSPALHPLTPPLEEHEDLEGTELFDCLHSLKVSPRSGRASSAALRESMEADRVHLNSIQRSIRLLAESGEIEGIEEKIMERTMLAVRANSLAVQLHEHIQSVRTMQNGRQKVLASALSKLEELKANTPLTPSALPVVLGSNGSPPPLSLPPAVTLAPSLNPSLSPIPVIVAPTQTALSSEPEDSEQCSLTEWESIVRKCSESATAIDSSCTEAAVQRLREALSEEARIASEIQEWLSMGGIDMLSSLSIDSMTHSLSYSPAMNLERAVVHSPKVGWKKGDKSDGDEFWGTSGMSLRHEANIAFLDKSRMAVKEAADSEIEAISGLDAETKRILSTTFAKGCGLLKNFISQNRLDVMEISAMETEMKDWLEILQRLMDPEEMRTTIERLVAENHLKEEHLLVLEGARIDIKSALEKASLKKARKRSLPAGSLSSASDDFVDSLCEIKVKLANAERAVKSARREMREWYREVRELAGAYAPELFHLLPDLQFAGSLLGDGGFAEHSKLPKRHLEDYDDIRPFTLDTLSPDGTGGGDATIRAVAGRQMLLRASYYSEEVVLKGFVMGEKEQRVGLERELAILARLRNESVICPRALIEDFDLFESTAYMQKVAVFIEYPFYKGGNLSLWLKSAERKPWELQGIARQLLYALLYVHDRGVTHRDIKPSNVLMHEDGRVVLADFEFSREIKTLPGEEEASTTMRAGTRGFMAPEVESGGSAVFASDMYSFGMLLLFMHYPTQAGNFVPGSSKVPQSCENELADLIDRLTSIDIQTRPTAAQALMHPYFRSTFIERLQEEGEVVEQDRKLEAVRDLFNRVRLENRNNLEKLTVSRENVTDLVLTYFQNMTLDKMRASLKIIFVGEPGVDEGGLLTEMFTIFFESVLSGHGGLFQESGDAGTGGKIGGEEGAVKVRNDFVLPNAADITPERMGKLRAFGRAMVKALFEGRRIGNRLCPSLFKFLTGTAPAMRDLQMFDPQTARSLQWTLATAGVEEFGMHFESVGEPDKGPVTDTNKAMFVRAKIDNILVKSRLPHLLAIKAGFSEALKSLSLEAAPFLSLLSHTDWRVMLCGDSAVSGPQVNAALNFVNFPKKSQVPVWLKEIILSSSEDHLRKFLVFVTGSPSISSTSYKAIEINVRCQARSGSLPIAHTCFFHLDIPDYRDKETLMNKLTYAVDHATTFEIV